MYAITLFTNRNFRPANKPFMALQGGDVQGFKDYDSRMWLAGMSRETLHEFDDSGMTNGEIIAYMRGWYAAWSHRLKHKIDCQLVGVVPRIQKSPA